MTFKYSMHITTNEKGNYIFLKKRCGTKFMYLVTDHKTKEWVSKEWLLTNQNDIAGLGVSGNNIYPVLNPVDVMNKKNKTKTSENIVKFNFNRYFPLGDYVNGSQTTVSCDNINTTSEKMCNKNISAFFFWCKEKFLITKNLYITHDDGNKDFNVSISLPSKLLCYKKLNKTVEGFSDFIRGKKAFVVHTDNDSLILALSPDYLDFENATRSFHRKYSPYMNKYSANPELCIPLKSVVGKPVHLKVLSPEEVEFENGKLVTDIALVNKYFDDLLTELKD